MPNSPVSAFSGGFRNRRSFEAHTGSFTPSSSVYSGSVSQTSSALGRLIEYVSFLEIITNFSSPIQQIRDRKGDLHQVESVYIMKRWMKFSLPSFELRYTHFLANSLRPKLIAPAIVLVAYSIYSLFAATWFKTENYIMNWSTAPNVLYNTTWISLIVVGFFALYVGIHRSIFEVTVEQFFQYWSLYVVTVGILFGNRWRVSQICSTDYSEVFPTNSENYPEIDLVMLLIGIVIYMAVYAEMRFRRLIWVSLWTFAVYSGTAIGFGIPVRKANVGPGELPYDIDRKGAIFLSVSLFLLFSIAMLGKFTLELLQRRNFLELELASKRIDVLEKTINAIDDDNQPHTKLEQTHKRLKDAERIIEKVRLMGLSRGASDPESAGATGQMAFVQELETALALIRKSERNMTMLDFHKEVLLGPIKTGVEWKQEEVLNWIETVVNPNRGTGIRASVSNGAIRRATTGGGRTPSEVSFRYSRNGTSPRRKSTATSSRLTVHFSDDELGLSARSLMKSIGVDWFLSLPDLEDTLHSNKATDLSALNLVVRVVIGANARESLNCSSDVVAGFAKAVEDAYLDVPFHNAYHAAQVCHHVNVLMETTGLRRVLSRVDQMALSVAALCHDISHFGRTNAYLVETRHELAVRYNDASVLENFHAASTFDLIKSSSSTDITSGLSKREERRFRARVIQLILATDSATHFQLVAELRMRLLGRSLFEDPQMQETDKRVVMSSILRTADLGYHAMPLDVHTGWVERLAEEYAQQGDDERALGIAISPMCDRRSQDIPSMQIGFMNLVVMPLYDEFFKFVQVQNPMAVNAFGSVCSQLVANHTHWTAVRNKRSASTDIGGINASSTGHRPTDDESDGSELYIPVPPLNEYRNNEYSGAHSPFETNHIEGSDISPQSSRNTDLIQRVYSTELGRSRSESFLPRAVSGISGMPAETIDESSAISLTYSQAHGYTDIGNDYSPR